MNVNEISLHVSEDLIMCKFHRSQEESFWEVEVGPWFVGKKQGNAFDTKERKKISVDEMKKLAKGITSIVSHLPSDGERIRLNFLSGISGLKFGFNPMNQVISIQYPEHKDKIATTLSIDLDNLSNNAFIDEQFYKTSLNQVHIFNGIDPDRLKKFAEELLENTN